MHIGVKNRTEEKQVLMHDGKPFVFEPGQVRLVEDIDAGFIETRSHAFHPKVKNPKTGIEEDSKAVYGKRLFDVLTIDEALKAGARPDEDPRVLALRAESERKAQERKALLADLKASLVEDGWTPPAAAADAKKTEEKTYGKR
jgi:hypothetical protein